LRSRQLNEKVGAMFNQTLSTFVVLSGLSTIAAAQSTGVRHDLGTDDADTAPAPVVQTCTLPEIADTAPLEQVPGSNLMTVPVAINGTTKQFLLDFGLKKPTAVSPALMADLGLPENSKNIGSTGGPTTFGGVGANGGRDFSGGFSALGDLPVYDVDSGMGSGALNTNVRVGSFGIGNATGHQLQFMVAQKGVIGRSAPYDGFLTGNFFRQYDAELDFTGKKITWLTPTNCTDPNQVVFWAHSGVAIIPVKLADDGRLSMTAMVRGHVINAEIDTSSAHTVMRRDIADLYVGLKADKDMVPLGDLKDGMGMQIFVSNFPEIVFAGGAVMASNLPVLIQDYSMRPALDREPVLGRRDPTERIPDLAIGMDVLKHLHMYVVPGQGRVYVTSAVSN
jgi:hypothetical protein